MGTRLSLVSAAAAFAPRASVQTPSTRIGEPKVYTILIFQLLKVERAIFCFPDFFALFCGARVSFDMGV